MGDAAKVSSYDGLVLHLTKTFVIADPALVSVDIPIRITGTLTDPAYKGTPVNAAIPDAVQSAYGAVGSGAAGASGQQPRHASRWNSPEKGVGGLNRDSVSGNSGFSGQSARACKIKSISVVRPSGATDFSLAIYQKSGRSAVTDLKSFSSSGGTDRIDVIPAPPLDYADESTTTKGADGTIYAQLSGITLGTDAPSGTYEISLEVEPV
jgi:hypothetical protein